MAPGATVMVDAVTEDPSAPEIPNVPDVDADHVEKCVLAVLLPCPVMVSVEVFVFERDAAAL